jgi:hypothetical protein
MNEEKIGFWLSMEVKILPVIFKLSIFSEKIVKIKSGKFVGSASFHLKFLKLNSLNFVHRIYKLASIKKKSDFGLKLFKIFFGFARYNILFVK